MQILEEFTHSKRNNEALNEDGYFYNAAYVAVVDGVTNKSHNFIWSPSAGVQARKKIIFALKYATNTFTAIEMYEFLNECLKTEYEDIEFFKAHPNDRLQVNCIIYSAYRKEIWFFGDCHCLVDNTYFSNIKKIDILLANLRSFVYHANQLGKVISLSKDTGRNAILPFLEMQANLANTTSEYGYLVLDGIGNIPDKIKILPVKDAQTIILASDGYPILKSSLAASEDHLVNLKIIDPYLINSFKATKGFDSRFDSFDDRTYVKFTV